MIKNRIYLCLILSIIGIVVVGFISYEIGFNQGYSKAKQEVESKYQSKIQEIFPQPEEIFFLVGNITEIKEKVLTLRVPAGTFNPFSEEMVKKVRVADSTKILKQVAKSEEEFLKETEDYQKAIEEKPEELPGSPLPYQEINIEFSELKVGSEIVVEAEEDIKDREEFEAKKIILYE